MALIDLAFTVFQEQKRGNGLHWRKEARNDLDGGVEDAAEADGVLEESVDVEHGRVGAGVGDVVDVRHHLLAHPPRGVPLPEQMAGRALPLLAASWSHRSGTLHLLLAASWLTFSFG